jgi:DNA-binding NarL/FixJ family response regulator
VADVRVLIVDDQAPFRRAALAVLAATSGFEPVGDAASGEEAVAAVATLDPGLVLMDINLPGISGFEACRQINDAHPDVVVLLLSTYQADDLPSAADCGAAGYLNKEEFGPAVLRDVWARRAAAEPRRPS